MDFSSRHAEPHKHLAAIGAVVVLHVLIVYALASGLGRKVVEVVRAPVEAKIVEEVRKRPPPPERIVLPPPKFEAPPPPYIPPPEVRIATPPPPVPTITVRREAPPQQQPDIRPPAPLAPVAAPTPAPAAAPAPPAPAAPPAPPPAPPAPAPPAPVAVGVACPGYTEVLVNAGFPREAQRGGIEKGEVTAQFTVSAAGQVRDVEVVKSTSRLLNRGSVEAVRRFDCRPPGRDVLVTVEIAYQLE